ncbi:hypothetical protein SADUNF_Sadunf16G0020300 [Salix dunnii]|uniref:BED-type domain-containing protein n=1 Tax=Salix dunnii TaxID=1413687 RepID=A0A835J7H5_9ROSI|nr:hypothetical protein SADUNF_Sadunf16G0020300 [Salix dunnii]
MPPPEKNLTETGQKTRPNSRFTRNPDDHLVYVKTHQESPSQLHHNQYLDGVIGKQNSHQLKIVEEASIVSLPSSEVGMLSNPSGNFEGTPGTRRKKDVGWKHCEMLRNEKRVQIKCNYCAKLFKGGGIHRFKEHLAGRNSSGVRICTRVPSDVRVLMLQHLSPIVAWQRKRRKSREEKLHNAHSLPRSEDLNMFADHSDDVNTSLEAAAGCNSAEVNSDFLLDEEGTSNENLGKRKSRGSKTTSTIAAAAAHDADPLMAMGLEKADSAIHMTMGRFLYDIGASLDALDSSFFQPLIDAVFSGRSGVAAPSHQDFRGRILKSLVQEVKSDIEQYKTRWAKTGCSLLVEEWDSGSGITLLNFLVYCSKGTVFLKSVDASNLIYSTDGLYELLKQMVEEVGAGNVLQVITNGGDHYVASGKKLMDTFPSLYWAPCAARCIDQILEDFGKLEWINAVLEQAKSVTRFVYNNSAVLNLMRKYTSGSDIVRRGATHSATNFTALKQMTDFKLNLQTMVTSQEWMDCPYSKQPGGLSMVNVTSNQSFWSSCISIIRLTNPLLQVLGTVSSEKRAAMGYILSGIYRAKESIKRELVKREDYMVYWNILDHRWEQHWKTPLHAAGFFLNPKFFYSIEEDMHNKFLSRMFDCIERLVPGTEVQDKIVKELNLYKNAEGDLGRKMAIRARDTLLPADWWSTYGGACPNLARLAIRILSQTCSSIGCSHNHIHLERVYRTRNCLQHQRLSDLVFVQYNLRLRQMVDGNKKQIPEDPVSFDDISIIEDWITQNGDELYLEDNGSSDWMSLVPPSVNMMPLVPSTDESEDVATGFDDFEIFNGLKEV